MKRWKAQALSPARTMRKRPRTPGRRSTWSRAPRTWRNPRRRPSSDPRPLDEVPARSGPGCAEIPRRRRSNIIAAPIKTRSEDVDDLDDRIEPEPRRMAWAKPPSRARRARPGLPRITMGAARGVPYRAGGLPSSRSTRPASRPGRFGSDSRRRPSCPASDADRRPRFSIRDGGASATTHAFSPACSRTSRAGARNPLPCRARHREWLAAVVARPVVGEGGWRASTRASLTIRTAPKILDRTMVHLYARTSRSLNHAAAASATASPERPQATDVRSRTGSAHCGARPWWPRRRRSSSRHR